MLKPRFFGVLIAVLCLLFAFSARAAERNTLVFISDLHMNVDVSYSWLQTNAPALAAFINRVNGREDVAELIVLGDMLDGWIETVENVPHTFQDILISSNNAAIVAALQAVCRNPDITVTYVVGNHDMLSFEPENKSVITNTFPGLNIISDSPGLGAYTKNNVIWAEHGHRYGLFNAPDTWSRANGHLPLGYFISRIVASKSARENTVYTTMDALDALIKSPGSYYTPPEGEENAAFSDEFIAALFDAFALVWGGEAAWTTFTMDGLDHFTSDPSVAHIGNVFNGIFSNWPGRMNIIDQYNAVLDETGDLSSAANLLFEMPDRIKDKYPFIPRIVIFAHTHEAAFLYHSGTVNSIYANTGTWIDGKPQTWVEIEINHAGGNDFYTVSLWYDGESMPRQRAALDASYTRNWLSRDMARDFDGDGKTDLAVYHEESGYWHVLLSESWTHSQFKFGETGYTPVPGDYDGDGKADIAVYHEASGYWFIRSSSTWELTQQKFGETGYMPVPGDYDGDGITDMAVYHEATGYWYILLSDSGYALYSEQFGGPGHVPLTR